MEHRPAAVDEQEAEPEELGLGSAVAMILVAVVCVLLAVLPVAVALQAPALPVGWLAAGLGSFVWVIFSLKLVTGAWGVAAQLWSAYPARVVTGERGLKSDMEGNVKGVGGAGRGREQGMATVITLICAGRRSRSRMTVSRHRAASD